MILTQSNLDHGHMYLTECMDMFPENVLGGPNKSHAAARTVQIQCGSEVVDTDIDQGKHIFRHRGWIRRFFSEGRMVAGDRILLERLSLYTYRVSNAKDAYVLCCLSIQQPWADLILAGKKPIENRKIRRCSKLWEGQDCGLLGIHASAGHDTWDNMKSEKLREEFAPGWRADDSPVRGVLGVVDVVQICRPHELPIELRDHKFVDKSANWCYVFENPRKLSEPFKARGNSGLFNVCIPRSQLPEDVR